MRSRKETYEELTKQQKILKDLIRKGYKRDQERTKENVKQIIKQKKLVNALEIEMWEFSL